MSVVASLKNFLKEKGFERYKGSCTYFKVFRDKYYAIAEVYRDRHHFIYNESENCFYDADGYYYDMHIDIWHESLNDGNSLINFCAGNSLCELSETSELKWINSDGCSEHRIVEEIENAFNEFFYNPLFSTENSISIYDYLCKLDMVRCKCVFYNSELLEIAALDEKRYDEALICVKCILLNYSPFENYVRYFDQIFLANMLTDEIINNMRNGGDPRVKPLIEEYDRVVSMMKQK